MQESVAIVVLGLTALAFVLRNPLLHMVCILAWLFFGFFMYNQTWPTENVFLDYAFMLLSIAMVIVHTVTALNHYLGLRTTSPTHSEIQLAHRKRVLSITHRKKKQWWEE